MIASNRNCLKRQYYGVSRLAVLLTIAMALALFSIIYFVLRPPKDGRSYAQATNIILARTTLKIEEYAAEHNGIYPIGSDYSSAILYQTLSGDPSGQGETPTKPIYWSELNGPMNQNLVGTIDGKRVILDGFGNSLRYQSALDKDRKPVSNLGRAEEDFNLWSIGPDGLPAGFSTPGNFVGAETQDDIWQ